MITSSVKPRIFVRYLNLGFFVALLANLLAVPAFGQRGPVPVFVADIRPETYVEKIEALGRLKANESVTITASVTEILRALHFDDGDRVNEGQILAEMTNQEENALLEEAQSKYAEAKRQYQRVQSLLESNLSNEATLDQRREAFESTRARLLATQSRLDDRLILAPFSGVLGLRNISVGTLVNPGDTVTTLDDDSVMKLDISLPSIYLQHLKSGLTIEAKSNELSEHTFSGQVTSVDSRINPRTHSILVRAKLPNPQFLLRPGMLMTVTITTIEQQSLLVPEEALIQEGHKKFVFIVDPQSPQKVKKQELLTGARSNGKALILSGLTAGDKVVTHGIMKLKNGAAIKVLAGDDNQKPLEQLLKQKANK